MPVEGGLCSSRHPADGAEKVLTMMILRKEVIEDAGVNFHPVLPPSRSMTKGSQLYQLKSALSQAGATKPQRGNKRKRSVNEDVDKERRAAKLREIQQKMNPFDVQVTKTKHDVGGRKIKGAIGRPAQSRQAGIQQVGGSSILCSHFLSIFGCQTAHKNST
jgi:hypothetical protein